MAAAGAEGLLYHEKQVAALCGQHCLNTLLQGPYFSEVDLAQIAHELDALEQSFMAESGMDSEAYKVWQKEASGNVALDGMFSIQVLSKALEHWNLSCTNLDSPEAQGSRAQPENEEAFICNLQEHWFTIRRISGSWYNFNSLFPAPEFLGSLYLTTFLATLREQGYSIFVVRGRLPNPHPDAGSSDSPGHWFSPQQAKSATQEAVQARESGYLQAALNNCMEQASQTDSQGGRTVTLRPKGSAQPEANVLEPSSQEDDAELAQAIAASLGQDAGPSHEEYAEDPELAAALAASLEDSQQRLCPPSQTGSELREPPAAVDPGPEPAPGPGMVAVALRLPDGSRLVRRFRSSDQVQDVLDFLRWKDVSTHGCVLTAFPRKVIRDPQQSLAAAGIGDMEMLTLQKA